MPSQQAVQKVLKKAKTYVLSWCRHLRRSSLSPIGVNVFGAALEAGALADEAAAALGAATAAAAVDASCSAFISGAF